MTEKIVLTFYNILCIVIACFTIGLFCFILTVFVTQEDAPLDFSVTSVTVEKAQADDERLLAMNENPGGWYKAVYNMSAASGKYSPYSYRVGNFALKAPGSFKYSGNYFLTLDDELDFSKNEADDFILTMYIKSSLSEQEIVDFIKQTGFGTRNVTRYFSFLKKDITMFMPGFMMSDFPDAVITAA